MGNPSTWLAIYLLAISKISGSVIDMTASPGSIKPYMTPRLVLRCEINDTSPNVAGSLVGRDVAATTVTSTVDNVALVTSMTLLKKDHGTIATVTIATPAVIVGKLNNASVSGDVKGGGRQRGHLDMTFVDPTEEAEGTYTCEVNALNNLGHNIVLQKTVTITTDDPSLPEAIKHMYSLDLKNRALSAALNQAKSQISQQASQISSHESLITDLQNQLTQVESCSRHVEVQELVCYGSCEVSFAQAYDSPPAVMVSLLHAHYDVNWLIQVQNITTTGFTLAVSFHTRIGVRWMSVEK